MIVILGSGRSGTTWLGKIFDSHRDTVYLHEPDYTIAHETLPFFPEKKDVDSLRSEAATYLDRLCQARDLKSTGSLPVFEKSYRGPATTALLRYWIRTGKAVEAVLRKLGATPSIQCPRFLAPRETSSAARPTVRHVIKSVNSPGRAYLFAQTGRVRNIIQIVRHPCGQVASRLRGVALGKMDDKVYLETVSNLAVAKSYDFTLEALRGLSLEEQMAWQWALVNEAMMVEMDGWPGYRLVRYEDLCREPISVTKDLFEACGLDWCDQTAAFLSASTGGRSGSERYFDVFKNPLQAATKWRQELTGDQIDRIMGQIAQTKPGQLFLED